MPNNTRSYGANARQMDWDDDMEAQGGAGRTGSWMPLDGLDDELFAAGPQLRAVAQAAPAAPALPWRREKREERIAPTRPQPATQRQTAQRAAAPARAEKVVEARAVMLIAGAAVLLVTLYAVISAAVEWTQVKLNDLQYGRPRTMQMDAYVGHSEAEGVPSHFVAMNLNRRVTILEMPGGDSSKVNTIVGPYLFGQGEDLTPVTLNSTDLNTDGRADLIVSVKNEQLLYLNDGATFKLATTEERLAIEKAQMQQPVEPQGSTEAAQEVGR
jgi:hypothetical protein